jgi:protein gp37
MMTKIEWASLGLPKGVTWNPIRARHAQTGKRGWHCEKVSPACEHCYAEALNAKAGDTGGTGLSYKPGHRQNGDTEIYLDEKTLLQPLSWRAPRGVFVCSMTDIFGDWVKDEWLDRIFAVMALCPQHRFAVLTKRPKRMREYFRPDPPGFGARDRIDNVVLNWCLENNKSVLKSGRMDCINDGYDACERWPLPNVRLGVTAEDQPRADERIPDLLGTPAAVRFVSIEPMLGPVDLADISWPAPLKDRFAESDDISDSFDATRYERAGHARLDWAICGGESGPSARPMSMYWAQSLRDQCRAAGVPFFFKQWGEWLPGPQSYLTSRELSRFKVVETPCEHRAVGCFSFCVGKKRAGRLFDGKEYSEFPEPKL